MKPSDIKVHFIVKGLNSKEFDNSETRRKFRESVLYEMKRTIEKFGKTIDIKTASTSFEEGDIDKDALELRIGFKYDHHAYRVFDKLDSIKVPRVIGVPD